MHKTILLLFAAVAEAEDLKSVQAVKIQGFPCTPLNIAGVQGNFQAMTVSFRTNVSGLGGSSPKATAGDVVLTKEFDQCSVFLFQKNVVVAKLESIEIMNYVSEKKGAFLQPTLVQKMRILLEGAYIRSYQISTLERPDTGPVLLESVTIAYDKITLRHFDPPAEAGYDQSQ